MACNLSDLPVIYNQDDELVDANVPRKIRRAKMKQRSRTLHERRIRDQLAKEETFMNKGDLEKPAGELNLQGQELFSSGSSVSSGEKANRFSHGPACMVSPAAASHNQKMSPRTQGHPSASNNIKNRPPLPASKTRPTDHTNDNGNAFRLNRVSRSASTREFRNLNQNKQLESLYA